MSKNDYAWEKLFKEHNILGHVTQNGIFEISSDQINRYRESRLMTKFDHSSNLPRLFSENNLSILPITRGTYLIGRFDAYFQLKYDTTLKSKIISFPSNLESIDHINIYSESAALNCAFVTSILKDVAGEEVLPTISGRMSTSNFDFDINSSPSNKKIKVRNSQCEIDGGYEGENTLLLIEAKNYRIEDFLIRQLYYPYRLWQGKIKKEVIPVFLTYSNDTFSFFKFKFEIYDHYNSIKLIDQKNYIITSEIIKISDIERILYKTSIVQAPVDIPFPQADNFERVVDLTGLLYSADEGALNNEFITTNYSFDKRQTSYYAAAGRYLGLIKLEKGGRYSITKEGQKIMSQPYYQKYLALVQIILSHEVFNKALKLYFAQLAPISKEQIVHIMKESMIYGIESHSTYLRRAQTVSKWIDWIIGLEE